MSPNYAGRVKALQADIEAGCGLDRTMAQELAHQLIGSRLLSQEDGRGCVAELMRRQPQASRIEDLLRDLFRDGLRLLVIALLAGEEPIAGVAAFEDGPEL